MTDQELDFLFLEALQRIDSFIDKYCDQTSKRLATKINIISLQYSYGIVNRPWDDYVSFQVWLDRLKFALVPTKQGDSNMYKSYDEEVEDEDGNKRIETTHFVVIQDVSKNQIHQITDTDHYFD